MPGTCSALDADPVELQRWRGRLAELWELRERLERDARTLQNELRYIENEIKTVSAHLRRIS